MADTANYVIAIILEGKDKNAQKVLRQGGADVEAYGDKVERMGQRVQQAMTGAAIAMTFGRSIPIMRKAIDYYMQGQAALIGLGTAVRFSGEDVDRATAFLKRYTDDGLVPVTQAAASLKNLLLAGYGFEEAEKIMRAFKDFAAFGRQGQLSMGEAIERSTQGLKQQLATLTDNAGWVTNLNEAYKNYARLVDKGAGSLTELEKRQAIVRQVTADWAAVMGDAEKASDQLMGSVARQEAKSRVLWETLGGALEPSYQDLLQVLGPITDAVTSWIGENEKAAATLLGGSGLVAALGLLFTALTLMGPTGAVVVGVVAGIVAIAGATAALAAKLHPSAKALEEKANAAGTAAEEMRGLKKEYVELAGKPDKSAEEHRRLRDVMEEIAGIVPEAVEAFDAEGRALGLNLQAIEAYVQAKETLRQEHITRLEEKREGLLKRQADLQDKLRLALAAYPAMQQTGTERIREYHAELESQEWAMQEDRKETTRATRSKQDFLTTIQALKNQLESNNAELASADESLRRLKGSTDEAGEAADDGAEAVKKEGEEVEKAAGHIRVYNELVRRFIEEHGGMPETIEEWIDLWRAWRDEITASGEALDVTEKDLDSFEAKLKALAKRWGDWGGFAISSIDGVTNAFGDSLAFITGVNRETVGSLEEIWGRFFEWFWQELMRMVARAAMLGVLKLIFPGISLESGGTIEGAAGGTVARAQRGGKIVGPVRGFDAVPVLAQVDETFLSVDLTRRLERVISDIESARATVPVAVPPQSELAFPAEGGDRIFQITALDAQSLRDMIRHGPLGRELADAAMFGRLP